jgi:hypothetical protein
VVGFGVVDEVDKLASEGLHLVDERHVQIARYNILQEIANLQSLTTALAKIKRAVPLYISFG